MAKERAILRRKERKGNSLNPGFKLTRINRKKQISHRDHREKQEKGIDF
jgi:hypothetical protein